MDMILTSLIKTRGAFKNTGVFDTFFLPSVQQRLNFLEETRNFMLDNFISYAIGAPFACLALD